MQYIFSEEEYNTLQSRNNEPKYSLQNGMAMPKLGAYIQFAHVVSVREVAQFRCFEASINGDIVWFPICLLKSAKFYKSLEKIKNIKLRTTDDFEKALLDTTIKCVPDKINHPEFIAIG